MQTLNALTKLLSSAADADQIECLKKCSRDTISVLSGMPQDVNQPRRKD